MEQILFIDKLTIYEKREGGRERGGEREGEREGQVDKRLWVVVRWWVSGSVAHHARFLRWFVLSGEDR